MSKSNYILLETLLKMELALQNCESYFPENKFPLSFHFDFSKTYDLFHTLVSAFAISSTQYENLYDILQEFITQKISISDTILRIESLVML